MLSNMLPGAAGTSTAPPFVTVPGPGGPIFVPGPGGGAPPVTMPAPPFATLITLRPDAATLTTTPNTPVVDFAGVRAIRFRRNSSATFAFSFPPGATAAGARVRLQWGFLRTGTAADTALTWEVTLRLLAAGDDLFAAPALPPVAITAQTPAAQDNRLQATAFVPLPSPPAAQPTFGTFTVTLRTTAAIPGALEIHLILADLDLGGGH
jgi:hypothetical protein